jgi:hypothetical protein
VPERGADIGFELRFTLRLSGIDVIGDKVSRYNLLVLGTSWNRLVASPLTFFSEMELSRDSSQDVFSNVSLTQNGPCTKLREF